MSTRREVLGGLGVLAVIGAVALAEVATAPRAEALTRDPVLHLVRRATYGPTAGLLYAVREAGRDEWLDRAPGLHP